MFASRAIQHHTREQAPAQTRQTAESPTHGLTTTEHVRGSEPFLQRYLGNSYLQSSSVVHDVVRSSGRPLDPTIRADMEARFRADFSHVRVHIDTQAVEPAQTVGALAYTVGSDIVFGAGTYCPGTLQGRHRIAHELAHTLQQPSAPGVQSAPLAVSHPEDSAEREADRVATSVMAGEPIAVASKVAPMIQRQPLPQQSPDHAQAQVRVIADRGKRKLRVVLVNPENRIVAGLAEITPPEGVPLNPNAVMVYVQQNGDNLLPQIRVQTPEQWSTATNLHQDVSVEKVPAGESDAFHVTDISTEELAQLRSDLVQFALEGGREFPELAATLANRFRYFADKDELKAVAASEGFKEWSRKRQAAKTLEAVRAENAAFQRQLGLEGVTPAEAREIMERYRGRSGLTDWEKEARKRGQLQSFQEIRSPDTGLVVAYRDLKLRGRGKEFWDSEEYIRDIEGRLIGGHDAASRAVYAPHDYILDPLGIQDLMGVAESDSEMELATDLLTGGVKAGVKVTRKGVKAISQFGKRAAADEIGSLARPAREGRAGAKLAGDAVVPYAPTAPGFLEGPYIGPTAGLTGNVASRWNQLRSATKRTVSRLTGGGEAMVEGTFRQTYDLDVAKVLAEDMIEKTPGREVGIWQNTATEEVLVVQGSGNWIQGAVDDVPELGGPWTFVEHYHPERNFAVPLPSVGDFEYLTHLAVTQHGGLNQRFSSQIRFRDPKTRAFHFTEYGYDPNLKPPSGPYFVKVETRGGVRMDLSFDSFAMWEDQLRNIARQDPGFGTFGTGRPAPSAPVPGRSTRPAGNPTPRTPGAPPAQSSPPSATPARAPKPRTPDIEPGAPPPSALPVPAAQVPGTVAAPSVSKPGQRTTTPAERLGDDDALKLLESGGETGGFEAVGPGVRIPVNKEGKPARVLEVGAGPKETNLGLPPDTSLVEVKPTDIQSRPGVEYLDATKPIPAHFVSQFDTAIINNPRGYTPDIAELGEALRPGGLIIVQGRGRIGPPSKRNTRGFNPDFQKLLDEPPPPGFEKYITRKEGALPPAKKNTPADILGGPEFYKTEGDERIFPNARVIFIKVASKPATPAAAAPTKPAVKPEKTTAAKGGHAPTPPVPEPPQPRQGPVPPARAAGQAVSATRIPTAPPPQPRQPSAPPASAPSVKAPPQVAKPPQPAQLPSVTLGTQLSHGGDIGTLGSRGAPGTHGVFEASMPDGTPVAVKVYPDTPEFKNMFPLEMQAAEAVSKTSLGPRFYGEVQVGPGRRAFAMEPIKGDFPVANPSIGTATHAQEMEAKMAQGRISDTTLEDVRTFGEELLGTGYYYRGEVQGLIDTAGRYRPIDFQGVRKLSPNPVEQAGEIKTHWANLQAEIDYLKRLRDELHKK